VVHILKQLLTICHGHMTLADGSLPGSVLPHVLQGMASYLDAAAVQAGTAEAVKMSISFPCFPATSEEFYGIFMKVLENNNLKHLTAEQVQQRVIEYEAQQQRVVDQLARQAASALKAASGIVCDVLPLLEDEDAMLLPHHQLQQVAGLTCAEKAALLSKSGWAHISESVMRSPAGRVLSLMAPLPQDVVAHILQAAS
jgi:hypothetical protein